MRAGGGCGGRGERGGAAPPRKLTFSACDTLSSASSWLTDPVSCFTSAASAFVSLAFSESDPSSSITRSSCTSPCAPPSTCRSTSAFATLSRSCSASSAFFSSSCFSDSSCAYCEASAAFSSTASSRCALSCSRSSSPWISRPCITDCCSSSGLFWLAACAAAAAAAAAAAFSAAFVSAAPVPAPESAGFCCCAISVFMDAFRASRSSVPLGGAPSDGLIMPASPPDGAISICASGKASSPRDESSERSETSSERAMCARPSAVPVLSTG